MKKTKLKLDKQSIQEFFFRHSEKLFFALTIGLIALFFWIGFSTPSYDETTPAAMLATSLSANDYIHDSSGWERIAQYRQPLTDAAERIQGAKPVNAEDVTFRYILAPSLRTLEKRTDPALLKPGVIETQYLRAQVVKKSRTAEPKLAVDRLPSSVLTLPDEQKGEMFVHRQKSSSGVEFLTVDAVVGMALIDFEAQLAAYRETFQYQRGYDPVRDIPGFAFIEVQRRADDSEWQPITERLIKAYKVIGVIPDGEDNKTIPPALDVIPESLRIPNVTLEIPPFLGVDYREFATLPEMKTVAEVMAETKRREEEKKNEEKNTDPGGNILDGGDKPDESAPDKAEPAMDASDDEEEHPRYQLIRFYDLEPKEPGVQYTYRVRLWFTDPNEPENFTAAAVAGKGSGPSRGDVAGGGGMQQDGGDSPGETTGSNKKVTRKKSPLLRDDLSAEVRTRLAQPKPAIEGLPSDWTDDALLERAIPGEWVESAGPVQATRGFERFVAGPVDPPSGNTVGDIEFFDTEPEVKIVVNSFQDDLGVFVPATTKVIPGSVLNFQAVTNFLHPVTWEIKQLFDSEDRRGDKVGRKFVTDAVLVDVMGGEKQPFSRKPDNFFAPADVLILDRNGKLILRNDLEDETAYRHANFVSEQNEQAIIDAEDTEEGDPGGDEGPSR